MDEQIKYSPSPWKVCSASDGRCQCGMISSIPADALIATVTLGEYGDEYPAIRLDNSQGSMLAKAEAYIEKIVYGKVPEDIGHANAHLIAASPELFEACQAFIDALKTGSINELNVAANLANAAIAKAKLVEPKNKDAPTKP